jgi:hypothetical protein
MSYIIQFDFEGWRIKIRNRKFSLFDSELITVLIFSTVARSRL